MSSYKVNLYTLQRNGENIMKKLLVAIMFWTVCSSVLAQEQKAAFRPLGYPGYTWGSVVFPSSIIGGVEENNILLQGKIEQGVDWFKLGSNKNITLNTFVDVGYSLDNKQIAWNNKITPGIGLKLKHDVFSVRFEYGIRYGYEQRWHDPINKSGTGVQVFVNWSAGWNLKK